MKFFTHDWAGQEVPAKYQAHISTLPPRMPATIRVLAQGVNIHDGRLRAATLDRSHHTLTLSMRCGDNQVGYFDLDLAYYEAVLRDRMSQRSGTYPATLRPRRSTTSWTSRMLAPGCIE